MGLGMLVCWEKLHTSPAFEKLALRACQIISCEYPLQASQKKPPVSCLYPVGCDVFDHQGAAFPLRYKIKSSAEGRGLFLVRSIRGGDLTLPPDFNTPKHAFAQNNFNITQKNVYSYKHTGKRLTNRII